MKEFKKYPDRRLYDVHGKRFANLKVIIAYIRAGEAIEVRCSKTGEDCTQSVLLSAFLNLPESSHLLDESLLFQLIRSTGPGVYNRRLSERINTSLKRLMMDISDLDLFYAQLNGRKFEE